jgi:hypothetical protein
MKLTNKEKDEKLAQKDILLPVELHGCYGVETLGFLELRLNTTKLKELEKHFL